jgi:hypothetical protein
MFSSIKRLLGKTPAPGDEGDVLAAWSKAEGHAFKRVKDKSGGGYVVETNQGWRVELGSSSRTYILGKELRFRADTGMPSDVQAIFVTKVLAQTFESDVFSRFTNAMQTQIDNTLPDEMRWLAMHPRVSLSVSPILSKRYVLFCNAEAVAKAWLDDKTIMALESAAGNWWADGLLLVLTLNRGLLTIRMPGQNIEPAQLKMVGELFGRLANRLREMAREMG